MPLADLADAAALQVFPIDPPLAQAEAAALCGNIDKLFTQFGREDKVRAWAAEVIGSGAVLLVAYESAEAISGCSKDMVVKVVKHCEERTGRQILSAPPIVVEVDGVPRCVNRQTLRALAASGEIGGQSRCYDTSITTLGAWRSHGCAPIAQTRLASLLQR